MVFFATAERSASTLAQQKDEVYVVGAGNAACRVWSEARARGSAAATAFSAWMQGYVTGAASGRAALHARIRAGAPGGSIEAGRKQYCSAHPEDRELCRLILLASTPREIMAAVSASEVDSWLDRWCTAYPAETLYRAAEALTGELDMTAIEAAK